MILVRTRFRANRLVVGRRFELLFDFRAIQLLFLDSVELVH